LTCQHSKEGIPALFEDAESPYEITGEYNLQVGHTNRDAGLPGSLEAHPRNKIRTPCCVTNSARTDRVTVGLFKAQKYVEHFYLPEGGSVRSVS
jgi:hypothetical protein